MVALGPADGVVVMGTTREPWACLQRDRDALVAAFHLHLYLAPPDWAQR